MTVTMDHFILNVNELQPSIDFYLKILLEIRTYEQ